MTVEYVAPEQNFSVYSMNAKLKYGDKFTHISLKLIEIFTHFKNFAIDFFNRVKVHIDEFVFWIFQEWLQYGCTDQIIRCRTFRMYLIQGIGAMFKVWTIWYEKLKHYLWNVVAVCFSFYIVHFLFAEVKLFYPKIRNTNFFEQ